MYLKFYDNPDNATVAGLFDRRLGDDEGVKASVRAIIEDVKRRGDDALREAGERFDGCRIDEFQVSEKEYDEAEALVSPELKAAIKQAAGNIEAFHRAQLPSPEVVTTAPGVVCSRKVVPIRRVGLYIPGGTAPLFSTVLMLALPARIAGCRSICLCTPAKGGRVNPAVLYAARVCGVDTVYKLGGAQAIAAMAYGTQSIEPVDKIFGPGNRYVTYAKSMVCDTCAIDMQAGPSEVMVVCDASSSPRFVASDLLSQAEHGPDSQVILIVRAGGKDEAKEIHDRVEVAIDEELERLGRREYMLPSLSHSASLAVYSSERLLELVNLYAPEHLIINTEDCDELEKGVESAGSIFLGPYSPESAGDYASGTNHTLPTSGWAHSTGGVSVDSFIKKITVQKLTKAGLEGLASCVTEMAEAENLMAHSMAVKVRLA